MNFRLIETGFFGTFSCRRDTSIQQWLERYKCNDDVMAVFDSMYCQTVAAAPSQMGLYECAREENAWTYGDGNFRSVSFNFVVNSFNFESKISREGKGAFEWVFKRGLTPPSLPQAMNCPSSIHHFNSVFLCSARGFHRSSLPVVYRHLFSLRARSLVWDLCYSAAAHYNIGDRFWKKLLSPRTGLNFFQALFSLQPK